MTLRLGTRASALARTQAQTVADALGAELVLITSEGDRSTASLSSLGGTGVFATALRDALLAGEVDVVVHSYKDLPTAAAPGLAISAVPEREDPRDALCARDGLALADLPLGARVGTGSPRRRAQLLSQRPDLELVDIRGNVDTRLGRVGHEDPERYLDAVILAAAGLTRLGRLEAVTEFLEVESWPTAPAQGALAVETRAGEEHLASALEHLPSRLAADAERGVLATLEAGCAAPVSAHAFVSGAMDSDAELTLTGTVYQLDGQAQLSLTRSVGISRAGAHEAAAALSREVATALLDGGAADLAPLSR